MALNDLLGGANGFIGTSDQDRYDEYETVIMAVLRNIRSVAQAWKVCLFLTDLMLKYLTPFVACSSELQVLPRHRERSRQRFITDT